MNEKGIKKEKMDKKPENLKNPTTIEKMVEFTFNAPGVKEVFLAGEFNNWDIKAVPLTKKNDKDWTVKMKLSPGRYEYKFFVDGTWVEDIPDVERVKNPFGTDNYIICIK